MRGTIPSLFLTYIVLLLLNLTIAEVTHEEIRGNIQSLIYSYNQLDNKLERHEHRERALGELLKKAMHALQKGQKNLEPINGIFGRLDERVSQIETMLITQEEKYNIQTEKLGDTLEHMFKWMRENDECYRRPPIAPNNVPTGINSSEKLLSEMIKELLNDTKKLSANVEKLLLSSKVIEGNNEAILQSIQNTSDSLVRMSEDMMNYTLMTTTLVENKTDNSFKDAIFEKVEEIGLELSLLNASKYDCFSIENNQFFKNLSNENIYALENAKIDLLAASDKAFATTVSRMKEFGEDVVVNINKIFDVVTDSGHVLEKFYKEMNSSYSKFNEGLDIFAKFNNILMTNSEYVLDTQRKVEFGTVQIVQKISGLLEKHREEVIQIIRDRFDNVDESMVINQLDTLQNISSVIETEISHVWRQIAIMHGEITDSKDLLTLMQGRNEVYVNSTFSTMDVMGKKVEDIKNRMLDMDSNLNFLLGKLSVMSQEFKNIKIGLAESLEELRDTFHAMQNKLPGPGPHTIGKTEYETELNLLDKRQAN